MNKKNPKIPKQRTGYRRGLRVYSSKEKMREKNPNRERKRRERDGGEGETTGLAAARGFFLLGF